MKKRAPGRGCRVDWARKALAELPSPDRIRRECRSAEPAEMRASYCRESIFLSSGPTTLPEFLLAPVLYPLLIAVSLLRLDWLRPRSPALPQTHSDTARAATCRCGCALRWRGAAVGSTGADRMGAENVSITPAGDRPVKAMVRFARCCAARARREQLLGQPPNDNAQA